ncbi:MAG: class I SAM-dependent methyltransferase [Candidatus Heimdallarchaeota archaeon]|nr:MAG: class I SAM-dependent methyltransferase [Candidatus Heimdallarchaeota archaeon]
MVTTNEYTNLTEDEKTVLGIITELETRDKDPKTNEITISESLKITLTGEGIKKLKMISEKNIDSDSAINSLIAKNLVVYSGVELELTDFGVKIGKIIRSKQMSDWYNHNLLRCAKSKAYAQFCEKVFGKNLYQFNVLDMDQLDCLISSLDLNSNDLVLDLGCGLGKVTEYIQVKTGAKITGIDFAEQLIQWAKDNTEKNNDALEFQVGNMNELFFPPSSFNAIYAIDTLYPTNIDDLVATITKLKELLKPNGQLGIFFAQIIESKEQQHILEPNQTEMAQALKNNNLNFTVIDFTQNARDIWEREISIGNELREMFDKEGNLDLCEDRIADGKRCVFRIDNQLQKRYFYHVSSV